MIGLYIHPALKLLAFGSQQSTHVGLRGRTQQFHAKLHAHVTNAFLEIILEGGWLGF